jgi:8-oxo-dGTP diphosphatase
MKPEPIVSRGKRASIGKTGPDVKGGTMPYRIAVLVFLENAAGEHLLLHRAKEPNKGAWSPIGGKLEMATGESPFECAVRETREETGHVVATGDLHLFAVIAEKAYEARSHWLMFLFRCRKPLAALPSDISEGRFGFFSRAAVDGLSLPETDRSALWPVYDRYRDSFVTMRADCAPGSPVRVVVEQITPEATGQNRA